LVSPARWRTRRSGMEPRRAAGKDPGGACKLRSHTRTQAVLVAQEPGGTAAAEVVRAWPGGKVPAVGELCEALDAWHSAESRAGAGREPWLRVVPFKLHVSCQDLTVAFELSDLAARAGFPNRGTYRLRQGSGAGKAVQPQRGCRWPDSPDQAAAGPTACCWFAGPQPMYFCCHWGGKEEPVHGASRGALLSRLQGVVRLCQAAMRQDREREQCGLRLVAGFSSRRITDVPAPAGHVGDAASLFAGLGYELALEGLERLYGVPARRRRAELEARAATMRPGVRVVLEQPCIGRNVAPVFGALGAFGVRRCELVNASREVAAEAAALAGCSAVLVRHWPDACSCFAALHHEGLHVVATDLAPGAAPLVELPLPAETTGRGGGGLALVFGNEANGISAAVRELADATAFLPMRGATQSLNLSAAVAAVLATLEHRGLLGPHAAPPPDEAQRQAMVLAWLASCTSEGPEAVAGRLRELQALAAAG